MSRFFGAEIGSIAEGFLKSWNLEAKTTHRVLDRLPDEKWDRAPHTRSMPLGKLSRHMVEVEAWVAEARERESFSPRVEPPIGGRDDLFASKGFTPRR